jgi:hypothetical protein
MESIPRLLAVARKARRSLGRQPPPKPRPGDIARRPIRSSWPSAAVSCVTSAPAASQASATALMNEILVARNALADPLTSSAVSRPITSAGIPSASGCS